MTTQNISLFQAMNAKMNYLSQRQKVISQNIANADTPGYQPKDLEKVDFGRLLTNVTKEKTPSVGMMITDEAHLPLNNAASTRAQTQKRTYEVAPSGNGVILEEQLMKSNDVQLNYNMMVNLYRSNVDMIRTALGKK